MNANDNVFPIHNVHGEIVEWGITVRNWLAAEFVKGMLANAQIQFSKEDFGERIIAFGYNLADEMIRASQEVTK